MYHLKDIAAKNAHFRVKGDFEAADDLLWAAINGNALNSQKVQIERAGRIGPLVEMVMARSQYTDAYKNLVFDVPFAELLSEAALQGRITGLDFQSKYGVFPLRSYSEKDQGEWILWLKHAELAAIGEGIPRDFAKALIGALMEMQDNIFLHSQHPETGLIAFAAANKGFEFVVADAGVGVLESLHQNPEFAALSDAGSALKIALEDGNSRLARSTGHGYGIGQLFRALAGHNGDLRFRSDDYVLTISGDSPSLQGQLVVSQKARLKGLIVTVKCDARR